MSRRNGIVTLAVVPRPGRSARSRSRRRIPRAERGWLRRHGSPDDPTPTGAALSSFGWNHVVVKVAPHWPIRCFPTCCVCTKPSQGQVVAANAHKYRSRSRPHDPRGLLGVGSYLWVAWPSHGLALRGTATVPSVPVVWCADARMDDRCQPRPSASASTNQHSECRSVGGGFFTRAQSGTRAEVGRHAARCRLTEPLRSQKQLAACRSRSRARRFWKARRFASRSRHQSGVLRR